jgi:hypothetical protein
MAFLLPAFSTKIDVVEIGCVARLCLELILRQKGRKRCWWTHGAISKGLSTGQFRIMFGTHRKFPDKFFLYYRASMTSFDELLNKTVKTDTNMRKSVGTVERMAATLR